MLNFQLDEIVFQYPLLCDAFWPRSLSYLNFNANRGRDLGTGTSGQARCLIPMWLAAPNTPHLLVL